MSNAGRGAARLGLAEGTEGIAPSSTLCLSFAKVHLPVLPVPMPNPRRARGFAPTLWAWVAAAGTRCCLAEHAQVRKNPSQVTA